MADTLPTLVNLVKLNDKNVADYGITDINQDSPLLRVLPAQPASNGTTHKFLKRTTQPSAGSRAINAGLARTFGADTIVSVDCSYFDADHKCDVAYAAGFGGITNVLTKELPSHLEALMYQVEANVITSLKTAVTANASMIVDAGGDTANATSWVFAIRVDGDREVSVVAGDGGKVSVGDTSVTQLVDGSSNTYAGYLTPIGGFFTLQVGSIFSAAAIKNIDFDHMLNDDLIAKLLNKAPSGRPFTHLIMNRTRHLELQDSRTATNPTGQPATFPTDAHGRPIIVVETIPDNYAVVA